MRVSLTLFYSKFEVDIRRHFFQKHSSKAYFNSDNGFIEIKYFYKITYRNFETFIENYLLDVHILTTEFRFESYSYKRNEI